MKKEMKMEFSAHSENEGFARVAVGAFVARLNPTVDELADIKTAVSEAVTNAIIHGYEGRGDATEEKVWVTCEIIGSDVEITITDTGKGISDIGKAMEPLFTTRPEWERSGMGFTFMEAFMDQVKVTSKLGQGTMVTMRKRIGTV